MVDDPSCDPRMNDAAPLLSIAVAVAGEDAGDVHPTRLDKGELLSVADIENLSSAERARIGEMFRAHFRFIRRSLRRLGVPELRADDAAQHVFVIATRHVKDIVAGREQAYLFRVATHVAMHDRRAYVRRREDPIAPTFEPVHDAASPEEQLDECEARELLQEVLEEIDLDLRVVFVLYELEEMGTHEIAGLLDLPRGTVASRLRRAREQFQSKVKRMQSKTERGGSR